MTPVHIANIPDELKAKDRWVVWRYESVNDRITKPLYDVVTGKKASSTDEKTWTSFQGAINYQGADGIGYVLGDGEVGIDFDNHIVDGRITDFAIRVIEGIDSYTETSPSGNGIHIIVVGKKPGSRCGAKQDINPDGSRQMVEMYETGRYFTMTGEVILARCKLETRVDAVKALYFNLFPPAKIKSVSEPLLTISSLRDDQWIIDKASAADNADKFCRLYGGDWSGYPTQHEADSALCWLLAYWTQDFEQIERIFSSSGLNREKWSEREDYRKRTIDKALSHVKTRYDPNYGSPQSKHPDRQKEAASIFSSPITFTDGWNASQLVAEHGHDIRFIPDISKWFVWDGTRFKEDRKLTIVKLAKQTVRMIYRLASEEPEKSVRKAIVKHAVKSDDNGKYVAMIELAKSEPLIALTPDELDSDPMLFNVQNGTIDLKTGKLVSHNRRNLITKIAPVRYDPEAVCPFWLDSLRLYMKGNDDLIRFLQRAIGYAMTGEIREHVLFIFYGTGANGKSAFFKTIQGMFGDYGKGADPELLLKRRHEAHPTGIADLKGARYVTITEVGENVRLNEPLVTRLTGGEELTARFMRENFFDFEPTHKLFLAVNHKPNIRETTTGIWRRVRLIPFEVNVEETLSADELLPFSVLIAKLKEEWSGILNWAVQGCLDWQCDGLGMPSAVQKATQSYRDEMDVVGGFITERCIENESASEKAKDLYAEYKNWCEDTGEYCSSQKVFGGKLTEKGFDRKRGSGNAHYWFGIEIVTDRSDGSLVVYDSDSEPPSDSNLL